MLLGLFVMFLTETAQAKVYWSTAAIACQPEATAIDKDRLKVFDNSSVGLRGDGKLSVTLYCEVTPNAFGPVPDSLGLTYKDSTGSSFSARVEARLVRIDRETGAVSQIAVVSSDSSISKDGNFLSSAIFQQQLDFASAYYYVTIGLERSASHQDLRSIGVLLESTCGNSNITPPETCDDGDSEGGDGCSASCQLEVCGNNIIEGAEQCDDGDTDGGDGCSATCTEEVCGNGVIEALEQCDDSNTDDGDGCSQSCTWETGFCSVPAQCAGSDTECSTRSCEGNQCGAINQLAGFVTPTQISGNCQQRQCDGSGGFVSVADDSDVQIDGNPCTVDTCSNGTPVYTFNNGAICSDGDPNTQTDICMNGNCVGQ